MNSWGHNESDTTEWLNWTEPNPLLVLVDSRHVKKKDDTCFLPFDPGPSVLSLCRVPSNWLWLCTWLINTVSQLVLCLGCPSQKPPHIPALYSCLLRHSPLSCHSLSFTGPPASTFPLCPSCAVSSTAQLSCRAIEGYFSALFFVFMCLCLA